MTSLSTMAANVPMGQDERIKRFGIECRGPVGDGILFKAGTWRPGGEYIQKLVIRNVSTEVKKLKYKLPSTRYFSLAYPEPIILSPGLSREVDVVFRPVEYEPYDDTLYIKMLDGISGNGFHIPVRATIDKLSLAVPDGLDLGYCPTHQVTEISFNLVNDGEIDAPYKWEVPEPFSFTPSSGTIPKSQHHVITVRIMPTDASVFVSKAVCRVGDGVHAIIPNPVLVTKLSAIGKYTHLTLADSVISFDEVVSGMIPDAKETVLANPSVVPVEFNLVRLDEDRDEVFEVYPKSGIIPPRSEVAVIVKYHALAMGVFSLDRYAFRTPSRGSAVLTLKGLAMPPKVVLYKEIQPSKSHNNDSSMTLVTSNSMTSFTAEEEGAPLYSLNFRDVELGRVETRILFLRNESEREIAFFVVGDGMGIFRMSPQRGIVPAMCKSFAVKVTFAPPRPINYYRRFFVLIGDALPLFYDCLGTGFIRAKGEVKEQRPAPIRHAHVQAYRNRVVQGLGNLGPEDLDMLKESFDAGDNLDISPQLFAQVGRRGTKAMSVTKSVLRPVTRSGEAMRALVCPAHEFFITPTDESAKEVVLSSGALDFGFTHHNHLSAPQTIVVHNHTRSKVCVVWHIPEVPDMDPRAVAGAMNASPMERDIITIDRAERELMAAQAFVISPLEVDIAPGTSQAFQVTFAPKQSNRNFVNELEAYVFFKNQRTFRLVNDWSLVPPWALLVTAQGHTFLEGQLLAKAQFLAGCIRHSKLVFPACFSGEAMFQTVMLRNTSNLPATYKLVLAGAAQENTSAIAMTTAGASGGAIFSVKGDVGEIDAESFVLVSIRYAPQAPGRHKAVLQALINGEPSGHLVLEGTAGLPFLSLPDLVQQSFPSALPEDVFGLPRAIPRGLPRTPSGPLYMPPTAMGLTSHRSFTLKNSTRLPLRFRLVCVEVIPDSMDEDGNTLPPSPYQDEEAISVTPREGVVKGNDSLTLTVQFSPHAMRQYKYRMEIDVYPIAGKAPRVLDAVQPGPAAVPETVQTLRVEVHAQGTTGALAFRPAQSTLDVQLVHTTQETSMWLENASDAHLQYALEVEAEVQPDGVDGPTHLHIPAHGMQSFSSTHAQQTDMHDDQCCLFCDFPAGIIEARSRKRLVLTYRPDRSGLFDFTVRAKVHALDDNALDPTASVDVHKRFRSSGLALVATVQARSAFPRLAVMDVRTDQEATVYDPAFLWRRFSLPQLNHDLAVPLTREEIALFNASTPDLSLLPHYTFALSPAVVNSPTQTVSFLIQNAGYLESRFMLCLPNEKTLELENWCEEVQVSASHNRVVSILEDLRLFTFSPRDGLLKPGESVVLTISYRHSSLKYDGIHDLSVLVKVAQGRSFVLDLKAQTLAPGPGPRKGSVRIMDPKTVLSLSQSVAPPTTAKERIADAATDFLVLLPGARHDGTVPLVPVPLGLSAKDNNNTGLLHGTKLDAAPLQCVELTNVSAQDVLYEVFLGEVPEEPHSVHDDYVLQHNLLMQVLRVANPSGVIPANGSVRLSVYFYPLQAKWYRIPFLVRYRPSFVSALPSATVANLSLTTRGTSAPPSYQHKVLSHVFEVLGFDPRAPLPVFSDTLYLGGTPPVQPLLQIQQAATAAISGTPPPQPVHLVEDVVDFDLTPQRGTTHRLVTLVNTTASQTYEFAVDESSCSLCVDGLVTVQPVFGKVLPGGTVLINLQLVGFAQTRVFDDRIKIMIREVVRTAARSRGGAKQALLDKLKARKSVKVEHESVVSRATVARSMQLIMRGVPTPTAAEEAEADTPEVVRVLQRQEEAAEEASSQRRYPSTVTFQGAVVQSQAKDHVRATLAKTLPANRAGADFLLVDGTQSASMLDTAALEGALSAATFSPPDGRSLASQGSRRLDSGPPSKAGTPSKTSASRGLSSSGSRLGTGSRGGTGAGTVTKFGVTYHLSVRLMGQIHSEDTLRLVYLRPRTHLQGLNLQPRRLIDTFALPARREFIPPIGKHYFDASFAAEREALRTKARVNISFVQDRDEELREVSAFVFEQVAASLLGQEVIAEALFAALTGINPSEVPLCAEPSLAPFDLVGVQPKVGVYFEEVRAEIPLHVLLVRELREQGILRGDEELLPLDGLKAALQGLGVERHGDFIKALDKAEQLASANLRGSVSALTPGGSLSNIFGAFKVDLRVFVWELLEGSGRAVLADVLGERRLRKLSARRRQTLVAAGVDADAARTLAEVSSQPSPVPATEAAGVSLLASAQSSSSHTDSRMQLQTVDEEPVAAPLAQSQAQREEMLQRACADDKFTEAAAHALSAMVFDLLQQLMLPPLDL